MTTVLLLFFGLSTCATLSLVAAVALGARRSVTDSSSVETPAIAARGEAKLIPAYSH